VSYLFDTDTLSNPLKRNPSLSLLRRLAAVPPEDQFTTTITVGEMIYRAYRSPRREDLLRRMDQDVWPNVQILLFDRNAAVIHGRLRHELEQQGTPLAEPDLRIGAIALARGLTLVTGNVRHFSRVPGLSIENWLG
jgi:tRNA(fMet)-specific endonuclease VapC